MFRKLLVIAKVLWVLAFGGGAVFMVFLGLVLKPMFFKMAVLGLAFDAPVVLWTCSRDTVLLLEAATVRFAALRKRMRKYA